MAKNLVQVKASVPAFQQAAANSRMTPLKINVFGIPIPTKINGKPGQVYVKNNKFYTQTNRGWTQLAFSQGARNMSNASFQTIPGPLPNWATVPTLPAK